MFLEYLIGEAQFAMRSMLTALALGLCVITALGAETGIPYSPLLTVLLSVDGKLSDTALGELKSELNEIMKDTGRRLDLRRRQDAASDESFEDVVLVTLKGTCAMQRIYPYFDERGPLGWSHTSDGQVLPFAEVSCDRIAQSLSKVMTGSERRQADKYLGRALGRVLAHELYHILGKTHQHNQDGSVAKEAISAKQLISDKRLGFDLNDLHRMLP